MWINAQGGLYTGDMAVEDRAATDAEIKAWRDAHAPSYAVLRRQEYPPVGDQLDALWKGGAEAAAMKAAIEAIKAKYPKPTGGN